MKEYIDQYRRYYQKYIDFLPEEVDYYEENIEYIEIKKKEFLLKSGEIEQYSYFIIEGAFRQFIEKDGKEICIEFGFPNNILCAFLSYHSAKPSTISVQALSNGKLLRLSKKNVDEFNEISKNSERFTRKTMEFFYTVKLKREISLLTTTAEERYLKLLEIQPKIIKIIPVKDLATYLGIHPESLSRIRKKVHRS